MSYVRAQFQDPAPGGLGVYTWTVMWTEEEGRDQRRALERTAITSGVGFVRQQGEDTPMTFKFTGTILNASQKAAFDSYYEVSRARTIFFLDFENVRHEVMFTAWNPQRKRTLHNPRDASIPLHYWTYSLELEVIRSGV